MNKDIISSLRPALVMTLLFAALLGLAYPLALTGLGQALFPSQANGSLVEENGKIVGSTVVGQAFTSDRYFNTRPSAAGKGYDGLASSGSNLGPTSQALADRVKGDVAKLSETAPGANVPPDLVTTSASGLDPDISPEAAFYQVDRIAKARGIDPAAVRGLVERSVEGPILGFLGEPRVNVFELNRRLDAFGAKPAA
ncbi:MULTISPECIES: potassium-transporting ATPase subunit KdpC [unclassified Sphingopyxis]|uniref:potassium-transporting ATPase subunit KdpC n=1 Tax=unclassified Sphingopyxis TaxID=2614943 RepID=UPI0007306278|nr:MULTISPECIES: potassium-transporting ATPase subunit KdpC [unclassified Sphingopyxis]KTE25097.1 ATPase [Sphingopyxis sp. H057]KTE53666.1 ATPase [Sphingopyxis sp. H073]KTE56259.1 ATPase [Sphingopyxis sp. H071]KTE61952.1 ATPase [Sphingopyxis sp. H107]KTE67225.1 ATPase [Sphingopyxis sp. H100]